ALPTPLPSPVTNATLPFKRIPVPLFLSFVRVPHRHSLTIPRMSMETATADDTANRKAALPRTQFLQPLRNLLMRTGKRKLAQCICSNPSLTWFSRRPVINTNPEHIHVNAITRDRVPDIA